VLGEVDANFGKAGVHRPLHLGSGRAHFGLDAIQQRDEVESFGTLRDPTGRQLPSGTGRHRIIRRHPLIAKRLPVGVLPDDIRMEPVGHPRKGDTSHHSIQFFGRQQTDFDQERRQELGVDISGFPQRQGQFVIGPDLVRQFPKVSAFDAKLIVPGTAFGVLSAHTRVARDWSCVRVSSRVVVMLFA